MFRRYISSNKHGRLFLFFFFFKTNLETKTYSEPLLLHKDKYTWQNCKKWTENLQKYERKKVSLLKKWGETVMMVYFVHQSSGDYFADYFLYIKTSFSKIIWCQVWFPMTRISDVPSTGIYLQQPIYKASINSVYDPVICLFRSWRDSQTAGSVSGWQGWSFH